MYIIPLMSSSGGIVTVKTFSVEKKSHSQDQKRINKTDSQRVPSYVYGGSQGNRKVPSMKIPSRVIWESSSRTPTSL